MSWSERTLGEVCDAGGGEVKTGPFGSQLHESDYDDIGTPVVMPKDIVSGRISEQSIARVGADHVSRLAQHQLRVGDVVFGRRGEIGRQALVSNRESGWLCGTGCLRITLGHGPLDPQYLHYYLRDDSVVAGIAQRAIGATLPNLNTTILRETPIRFPPLAEQRRIASILSAYDDLIENNTRRIAILEEMARRIYEEWFVHFRFPGHEHARMVESELGPVPDGWQRTTLRDIARVNQRSIKRGGEPDQIVYVDISSVSTGSIDKREPMPFAEAPGRARRIVGDGDIIWACVRPNRKSFSLVLEPEENLVVSTGFAVLSAESVPWTFLYQAVTTETFVSYLVNHATGAAYPAVGAADFENADVLVPDNAVLRAFNDIVEPMARLISKLRQKNTNLRTTRDLLLPKLISGELDVSALPEPEAVAA